MKKVSFLLILPLILLLVGCEDNKIDVTDTDFDYDVKICDKYFELVECIIDKDTNPKYTKQMREDLKKEVKSMQDEWKQLNEQELTRKCMEGLETFETAEMQKNLSSFGCLKK